MRYKFITAVLLTNLFIIGCDEQSHYSDISVLNQLSYSDIDELINEKLDLYTSTVIDTIESGDRLVKILHSMSDGSSFYTLYDSLYGFECSMIKKAITTIVH